MFSKPYVLGHSDMHITKITAKTFFLVTGEAELSFVLNAFPINVFVFFNGRHKKKKNNLVSIKDICFKRFGSLLCKWQYAGESFFTSSKDMFPWAQKNISLRYPCPGGRVKYVFVFSYYYSFCLLIVIIARRPSKLAILIVL